MTAAVASEEYCVQVIRSRGGKTKYNGHSSDMNWGKSKCSEICRGFFFFHKIIIQRYKGQFSVYSSVSRNYSASTSHAQRGLFLHDSVNLKKKTFSMNVPKHYADEGE